MQTAGREEIEDDFVHCICKRNQVPVQMVAFGIPSSTMWQRKKKLVYLVIGILALYSGIGFFLVPYFAKTQALQALQNRWGVQAEIEKINFNPFTFEIEVLNLKLPADKNKTSGSDRLKLGRLYLNLEILPLLKKKIHFTSFYLGETSADFIIYENQTSNWAENEVSAKAAVEKKPDSAGSKPWALTLDVTQIENIKVKFSDLTHRDPLELSLGPINLNAHNISTSLGDTTSLDKLNIMFGQNGRLQVGGTASLKPVAANVKFEVSELPLDFLSSYLSDTTYLNIETGTLDSQGELQYSQGQIQLNSNMEIKKFNLIQESTKNSALVFESLTLQNLNMTTTPLKVRLSEVSLNNFSSSLVLKKDGTLNYKEYLRPKKVTQSETSKPVDIFIEKFNITRGQLTYADQQIKPNFKAVIKNLAGVINPITTEFNKKTNINISGQVEAQGKFTSQGFYIATLSQPKLDLNMHFYNIDMTNLSPYSGKFAGYEISKGKMYLDLNYKLANNLIKGNNKVVLDQFTLGNKIESDDSTNLPVKLALALLKNREGKIEINLPVEGDVNSPKFSFRELIWTAFKKAITNITLAPFDFLKGLHGIEDSFDSIFFEPGTTVPAANQQAKIQDLANALRDRPNLAIEVQGTYQASDEVALKETRNKTTEEKLKALALQRGQLVQAALALKVEPERIYLLSPQKVEANEKPARTVLILKSRD